MFNLPLLFSGLWNACLWKYNTNLDKTSLIFPGRYQSSIQPCSMLFVALIFRDKNELPKIALNSMKTFYKEQWELEDSRKSHRISNLFLEEGSIWAKGMFKWQQQD
jgi:hypothetical protein